MAFLQSGGKNFYDGIGQGWQPRKKRALWITEREMGLRRRASESLGAPLGGKRNENGVMAFMLNISLPMTGIMAMDTCSWLRRQRAADTDVPSGTGANTGVLSSLPSSFLAGSLSTRLVLNEMKWTHGLTKALSNLWEPLTSLFISSRSYQCS